MAANHYLTKPNRRQVKKTRARSEQKRIAGTMAKLRAHEAAEQARRLVTLGVAPSIFIDLSAHAN